MSFPSNNGGVSRPEFDLIDWIRSRSQRTGRVPIGIGDDAASLGVINDETLVATDMLMEGVHFKFPDATPFQAGRKSLAVNLSDIAAMAGKPIAAFVAICLPKSRGQQFAREVMGGIQTLANEFDVEVAGGDTNSWDGPLVVSVTVVGQATRGRCITRSGAKPGDALFVTGQLGGSIHGKHVDFTPRVQDAIRLHESVELNAIIDLSDGLSSDIHHVLNQSQVGAIIVASEIPIAEAAVANEAKTPLERALTDGEDFELLFAVGPNDSETLQHNSPCDVQLRRIGIVTEELGARLECSDGRVVELPPQGWCHQLES